MGMVEQEAPKPRQVIKFSHDEVEALLNLVNTIEENYREPLNEFEQSAKEKLKRIYARQILSHERTKRAKNEPATSSNARLANSE